MSEIFYEFYYKFSINLKIFFDNPTGSGIIEGMRMLGILLLLAFVVKICVHHVMYIRLKRSFSLYAEGGNPVLFSVLRSAMYKIGLNKTPLLYKFAHTKPLIFTIGIIKPSIFISQHLADNLSQKELEAIFTHELYHIKRRDAVITWFFELLTSIVPVFFILTLGIEIIFNSTAGYLSLVMASIIIFYLKIIFKKQFLYLRELSCDDRTLKTIKDPLVLAATLAKVWRMGTALPDFKYQYALSAVQPFLTASQKLDSRIERLINYKRPVLGYYFKKFVSYSFAAVIILMSFSFLYLNSQFKKTYDVSDKNKFKVIMNKNDVNSPEKIGDDNKRVIRKRYRN